MVRKGSSLEVKKKLGGRPKKGVNYSDDGSDDARERDEPLDDEEANDYEVQAVRDKRRNPITGKLEYLLKWVGYPEDQSTWEPIEHCTCEDLIAAYEAKEATKLKKSSSAKGESSSSSKKHGNSKRPFKFVEDDDDEYAMDEGSRGHNDGDEANDRAVTLGTKTSSKKSTRVTCEWEKQVDEITTVAVDTSRKLSISIKWKNGQSSIERADDVHLKAPLKLIAYYEAHLRFN